MDIDITQPPIKVLRILQKEFSNSAITLIAESMISELSVYPKRNLNAILFYCNILRLLK